MRGDMAHVGPITKQTLYSQRQNTKMSFLKISQVFILLLGLSLSHVQSASAQDGDTCRHKKFNQCQCDEYAEVLTEKLATEYREHYTVYRRTDLSLVSTNRKMYYTCFQCTKCGDGILIERQCSRRLDAVCSKDKCEDPTWRFDFGLKACKPITEAPTPSPTLETTRTEELSTESPERGHQKGEAAVGTPSWLRENSQAIIISLVGGMTVLLVVVCSIAIMMIKMRRRMNRPLVQSGTPYSSQNTSNSSIEHV